MAKPRYQAEQDGQHPVTGEIMLRGTVFEFAGPPGSWMKPVSKDTPLGEPPRELETPRWVGASERDAMRAREHIRKQFEESRDWACFDKSPPR